MPGPDVYLQAKRIVEDAPDAKSRKKKPAPEATLDTVTVERQLVLTPAARTALNLSREWLNNGPLPEAKSGRVLFRYGQILPTVVCAILQVCEVDLEPGEKLTADALDWGDTRWQIASRTAGSGSNQFVYVVVKPTQVGLDTTLTIGTDRRSYYIRLISTSAEHMARVAFSYPDEEAARKKAEAAAQVEAAERQKLEAEKLAQLNTVGPIKNWDYTVELHGKDAQFMKPIQIGDDGIHTHIKMSDEARYRGLPVIEIKDAQGTIPANMHWEAGNELIVDALFENACLLEGVGKKQQRACIKNNGLKGAAN
jgi:type IV secretion system protein VirB9